MQGRPWLKAALAALAFPAVPARADGADIVLGHSGILGGPLGAPVKGLLARVRQRQCGRRHQRPARARGVARRRAETRQGGRQLRGAAGRAQGTRLLQRRRLGHDGARHQIKPQAAAGMKGDASNAADVAKTLAAGDPQTVLMYLGGALGGELMKATWALGGAPSFYGLSIVPGELIARSVGEKARGLAISQVVPNPWNGADPQVLEYQRLATAAQVALGYYTFEGYVNALVMLDALRRSGTDPNHQRLHAALKAAKLRIVNMAIDFSSGQHTGSRFVEPVQLTHQGRFGR